MFLILLVRWRVFWYGVFCFSILWYENRDRKKILWHLQFTLFVQNYIKKWMNVRIRKITIFTLTRFARRRHSDTCKNGRRINYKNDKRNEKIINKTYKYSWLYYKIYKDIEFCVQILLPGSSEVRTNEVRISEASLWYIYKWIINQ